jgi:hypothetical protein
MLVKMLVKILAVVQWFLTFASAFCGAVAAAGCYALLVLPHWPDSIPPVLFFIGLFLAWLGGGIATGIWVHALKNHVAERTAPHIAESASTTV